MRYVKALDAFLCSTMACTIAVAERTESQLVHWTCDGEKVSVPHTWNAIDGADGSSNVFQDADNSVAGRAFERRTSTYRTALPVPTPGKRQFVRCEGAAIVAMVCVNGRIVGRHHGAFTAFCYEITDFLREHENVLEVVVDNHFDPEEPPNYADYTIEGGLYRPVWLIETDPVCIDPTVFGGPGVEIDTDADTGRINVKTHVSGEGDEVAYEYAIDGRRVQELKVERPELWSPENPRLYELSVTVRCGSWSDTVRQRIGFKKVVFKADGLYLNGIKRKLHGVNYHQESESIGWALEKSDIARDLGLVKEMGADSVRTAHYPHSKACYDLCDELGLLSWIEFPASGRVLTSKTFVERLRQTVLEVIAQHRNHPSLLVWSLFNELYGTWDGDGMMPAGSAEPIVADIQRLTRLLDPRHPTVCAAVFADRRELNAISDVFAFNTYPGWYGTSPTNMTSEIEKYLHASGKTSIGIGEYGSGASPHHHEKPLKDHKRQDGNFHPEETQTWMHRVEYSHIQAHSRVWGSYVWAMFDFASDNRSEGDHKGVNDKGLVTHDRRTTKDAYHFYRANWNPAPQLYLCSKRMVETNSSKVDVMGFSNVGEVELLVNGVVIGRRMPDDVRTVEWNDVMLRNGTNTIELRAGKLTDRCTWRCRPGSGKSRVKGK